MKKSAKELINKVSSSNYLNSQGVKYPKNLIRYSDKYKKGKINTHDWIAEVCYIYQQREKQLKEEFINTLLSKSNELALVLKEGEYKNGALEGFKEIESLLDKNM